MISRETFIRFLIMVGLRSDDPPLTGIAYFEKLVVVLGIWLIPLGLIFYIWLWLFV